VRSLARIGGWTGDPADFPLTGRAGALRTAILAQARHGGPIVSAATDG
jgi:hypothetical protein